MRTGILDPAPPGPVDASALVRAARIRAARRRASAARHRRLVPGLVAHTAAVRHASPPRGAPLSGQEVEHRLDRLARVLVRTMRSVPMPGVAPLRRRDWLLIGAVVVGEALVVLLFAWAAR